MRKFESALMEERCQLERIVEKSNKRLIKAPKGRLRIRVWKGDVEYYYKEACEESKKEDNDTTKKNNNGRYLKKCEIDLAKGIAQRDYDKVIIEKACERIKVIDEFLKKYNNTNLQEVYSNMNPYRRELIEEIIIPDEEYVKRWRAVEYKGKSFTEDTPEIITERGERVRSKSEKIIADKLYMLGVPYRYEYPLTLEGGIRMYPDFTILRMPEREEVYLEHFGMMDDIDYVGAVM